MYDFETAYRAMASRDPRFDGRFVVAVTSTGVYCRPSCPSRTPHRRNVRFFRLPAAAETEGFRACRRCRPDTTPSSPEWNARGDLAARALRLIAGGAVDQVGVTGLSRRLSVSERHLHRLLVAEVGVGPQRLAISRRAQVARLLVESSALPLTEVAFAAGYSSVRQFNEGMRVAFGCPPSQLRRGGPARSPVESTVDTTAGDGPLMLRLRYRPPLAIRPLLDWLAAGALPGIEAVEAGAGRYHRTLRLPRGVGYLSADFGVPLEEAGRDTAVVRDPAVVRLWLADLRDVTAAVQRCREIFDLDSDPATIAEDLLDDPLMRSLAGTRPGLRVPGCADGFELAVRAVLGRQGSPAATRALGGRLVARYGEPVGGPDGRLTHLFPTPQALAHAQLEGIGLPGSRAGTIRALARAVLADDLPLDRGADREECAVKLARIPGVGAWTAGYVAMRALGDPDVFLQQDSGLRSAARALGLVDDPRALDACARRWRPWRSYAAMHLWASLPGREA